MSKINIIVATDFSPAANNALEYGIAAAREIGGQVIVFHLYKMSSHVANSRISARALDDFLLQKKAAFEGKINQLAETKGVTLIPVVRMGDFLPELEQLIEEYNARLLILGMPQKSIEQDLLGNTTTAAIYSLKFPILSIPDGVRYTGIKHILYACDMKRGVHATVLSRVKDYAHQFGAVVEVLHVGRLPGAEETKYTIDKELEDTPHFYKEVNAEGVVKSILAEARSAQADIIIMTPHRYGFWSSLFHRSKTRAMASNGSIPLLTIAY